jgi:hypothetical protein
MGLVFLWLPFEIIRSIEFKEGPNKLFRGPNVAITLGDGSVVEGRMDGSTGNKFVGQADIGGFSIDEVNVATLTFAHKPEATSTFVPRGKHTAVVHKTDGGQIVLTGATFMEDFDDKDGCWDGEAPVDTFVFWISRAEYTIDWSKVAAIVPPPPKTTKSGALIEGELTLTLRNGQTREGRLGSINRREQRIEGAISYGAGYKLRTTFYPNTALGYTKLELRD